MTNTTPTISAAKRTEFGKGAARRVRRANLVPAVLYGHGTDPVHLSLPGHQTLLALRMTNAILSLDVEGEEQLALVKDVQRNPIKRSIEHVDLVIVRKGEKVTVDVSVHVLGEAAPDTVVTTDYVVLTVEADALTIPESFSVSVEGRRAGTQILAGEIELPAGVTLITDPEALVVNVTQALTEEALEAELAEAEAEVGIEKDETDEEIAEAEDAEADDDDAKDAKDAEGAAAE